MEEKVPAHETDNADNGKDKTIIGISVISSIVSKVISSPSKVLSGIKQILFFYRLLPPKWKKRAFWIFERLWKKKQVTLSTDPEKAEQIYEVHFEYPKLQKLFNLLPQVDQAIMIQGKAMIDLINKGLHANSDEIKRTVEQKYGQRGLNIVNMLTTDDIQYLLTEIEDENISEQKEYEKKFNEWAHNYDSIAVLISPLEIGDSKRIKEGIIELSKQNLKDYILVNLSGKMDDCTKVIKIVCDLKEKKELNYINFNQDISDSGFCKSLRIKINFKKK